MSARFASTGKANFFFQPVQFDFQLADLLVQRGLQRLLFFMLDATSAGEQLGQLFERHFFPLSDLDRMHPIGRRQFLQRPLAPDRFQRNPGLELALST